MRAFIAIALPESIHLAIGQQQATFRAACSAGTHGKRAQGEIRWTRPEEIHLTLKFLDEIPEGQVQQVIEEIAALGPFEKFSVEVGGFGFFPDARRPRVFWVGVLAPDDLGRLAKRVEDGMKKLGFAPENRSFTPHLTLARFRIPRPQPALQALLEEQGRKTLGRFEVSEFFLFESRLSPAGAEYLKVARFPR